MTRTQKGMIISVGTGQEGKDVAHGICFSIQHHNPDFLVFLNTNKSKETTMPYIIEDCELKGRKWKQINIDDPDDVEKIVIQCQEAIQSLIKEGFVLSEVVVDYTSGTKAMSAGLTMASIREKVGILTYTTGKRGEGGRVISGTERSLSLSPKQIFADDLFREAVDAFNSFHFDLALKIFEEAKAILSDPEFLKKIELLRLLCQAYSAWDRFETGKAFDLLQPLRDEAILQSWGVDRQIRLNKQVLYQEKENLFCPERVLDLTENARRRGDEEHKYDDGVARLYRVCEYLGQFEIYKRGLYKTKDGKPDTSDLEISKLPESLQKKYSKYHDSYDGKVKVHLSGNYDLLRDLDHPLGIFFKDQEKRFKKLMGLRDLSILAHGFNPVSEATYRDMLELIDNLVQATGLGESNAKQRVRFPKIKIDMIQ